MPPPAAESPYRLFVEGIDDKYAIINLMMRHSYNWEDASLVRPFVQETGGLDPLVEAIPVTLKTHKRVGFVLDADLDLRTRWQKIRDLLSRSGIQLPENPSPSGVIVHDRIPSERVGVWVMPDNRLPGTLEDFLVKLVPHGDPCLPHAEAATRKARDLGAPIQEKDHRKGVIHAWLAWQESPGQPFGTAIARRFLAHDSPEALRFVDWFQRLFLA